MHLHILSVSKKIFVFKLLELHFPGNSLNYKFFCFLDSYSERKSYFAVKKFFCPLKILFVIKKKVFSGFYFLHCTDRSSLGVYVHNLRFLQLRKTLFYGHYGHLSTLPEQMGFDQ